MLSRFALLDPVMMALGENVKVFYKKGIEGEKKVSGAQQFVMEEKTF